MASVLSSVLLVWSGIVLGVSFIATPAKFLAPSLPLSIALDVGRHTFFVLNWVELGLAAIVGIFALCLAGPIYRRLMPLMPGLVVLAQAIWLLPLLDARVQQVMAGHDLSSSALHTIYIGSELAKLGLLIGLGCGFVFQALVPKLGPGGRY